MAIIDVVRFDGTENRDWLIYKYPKDSIVATSQLIVQPGQAAVFVYRGKVCDIFEPGTYTLSTKNLPILTVFENLPFGGETPFSAEVYFVNTTVRMDVYWGTNSPIQLTDPKYHVLIRTRAFGQMTMQVGNVEILFNEIIGGMQKDSLVDFDKVKEYFKGILVIKVKTAISDAILNNGISVLEISPMLEEISNNIQEKLKEEFAKYGMEVHKFYIQSINFPEEDFENINKILEDKAAFEIMGDSRYKTKRSFDVYEGAATNKNGLAGAFAASGIGMGAAVGMGAAMNQVAGNSLGNQMGGNALGNQAMKQCPACHGQIMQNANFCPQCGQNLSIQLCECGFELQAGANFCPQCGKKV